jgi:thioredoxin-like negative regulator of GroEL
VIESLLQAERLLLHGQLEAAERIYRQTISADPRNAIAVVGLARVALERGDDRLAYEQACAALEIDRENAAALRLEARLSEVLTTRGEGVARPQWLIGDPATAAGKAATAAGKAAPATGKAATRPGLLRRILGR